jgi:UDP-glucose 4-epimerase
VNNGCVAETGTEIMSQNPNIKTALVTGGTGYVGSHVSKYLLENGYTTISIDRNLSARPFANRFAQGHSLDYTKDADLPAIEELFKKHKFSCVFHLAANSLVGPSVTEPSKYYHNNVCGTIKLLDLCVKHNVKSFVFASTSSVYGDGHTPPITEDVTPRPLTSYGRSKLMVEGILKDYARAYGLKSVALRLFNVCSASPDCEVGEVRIKPTHLIPNVVEVAAGRKEYFSVFGTDYDTPDGTAIRDYTHVWDVAKAFKLAHDFLIDQNDDVAEVFNIGAGRGFSVKQVIQSMEKALGKEIKVKNEDKREGDPSHVSANVFKARDMLNWLPVNSEIDKICQDTVNWLNSDAYKKIDLEKIPS